MSDYFQNGVITTFHRLGEVNIKRLEGQLKQFSQRRPIALILPSLYREFASGALQNIMKILKNTSYFNQIVLCLDRANPEQYKKVKDHFNGKITIMGGIPSVALVETTFTDDEFDEFLDDFFEQIGKGDHLILGISDTTPPAAKWDRIVKINERVKAFGLID